MTPPLRLESSYAGRMRSSEETLSLCYQCGTCTATCPMGVPVRSIIRGAQLGLKSQPSDTGSVWNCATCKTCELFCPRGVRITNVVHALRVLDSEEKKTPPKLESAMWGVYEEGNPWGGRKDSRAKWADGLELKDALSTRAKYLLYVGCAASFDSRLQRIARSLASILKAAGTDFAILGNRESCCGDVVYQSGEEGFLEELIESNIQTFGKSRAETVVTISPHCYSIFKDVYPKFGKMLTPVHYTELLSGLIDGGALRIPSGEGSSKTPITYHDPCYLGRYNGIYEEPRRILSNIPGTTLTEMDDNKRNALCCGGGGGLMWLDTVGERPSHQRVSQAADTGASVLATSCPYCVQNFEDGAKTKGLSQLRVMDVAEIVAKAIKPGGDA